MCVGSSLICGGGRRGAKPLQPPALLVTGREKLENLPTLCMHTDTIVLP